MQKVSKVYHKPDRDKNEPLCSFVHTTYVCTSSLQLLRIAYSPPIRLIPHPSDIDNQNTMLINRYAISTKIIFNFMLHCVL